eukprot:7233362-Lingulodinium_polyedra.AAC.1
MPRANGDSWQGQVRRFTPAQEWCKAIGLRQTFSVSTKVGFDEAKVVADAWSHRMQFLYDQFKDGRPSQEEADAIMALYVEPENFVALVAAGGAKVVAYARAIRQLGPM